MDFQKVVRDMAGISERVEIKNLHRQLTTCRRLLACSGETVLHDSQAEDEAEPEPFICHARHLQPEVPLSSLQV
jgi:hypothetical protein